MITKTYNFEDLVVFNRSSNATYWDENGVMQTAATNEPRFDHDPVTGDALGLLCEEIRTNLLTKSDAASFFGFTTGGGTTVFDTTAPSSGTPYENVMTDVRHASSQGQRYAAWSFTPASSSTHVVYADIKLVTGKAGIRLAQTFFGSAVSVFIDTAGNLSLLGGSLPEDSYGAIDLASGWVRVWAKANPTNPGESASIYLAIDSDGVDDGEAYFACAQIEEGEFPTSYIPTSGATATRTPDYARAENLSPWFKQGGGTLYVRVQAKPYNFGRLQTFVTLNDQSSSEYNALIRVTAAGFNALTRYNSESTASLSFSEAEIGEIGEIRSAYSYAENDFGFSVNGLPAKRDSNGGINRAQDVLILGNGFGGWANAHIKEVRFYPYNMSTEKLEALTA